MRFLVVAAFINRGAGALKFPVGGLALAEGVPVRMGERVAPPCEFTSDDPEQLARLERALCLRPRDGGLGGYVAPAAPPPPPAEAVSHAIAEPAPGEVRWPPGPSVAEARAPPARPLPADAKLGGQVEAPDPPLLQGDPQARPAAEDTGTGLAAPGRPAPVAGDDRRRPGDGAKPQRQGRGGRRGRAGAET